MKSWYQSKTVWANGIVIVLALVTGIQEFLPALQVQLSPETYGKILFLVGTLNVGLRSITNSGITK